MGQQRSEFQNRKHEKLIHFAREALGLSDSISIELFPFEGRGSDRKFYRLKWNRTQSAILIHYAPTREENTLYPGIAAFLREIGVPVPGLIQHNPVHCFIAMEDLGDTDLWSLRDTPWEARKSLYQKTLSLVRTLHSFPEKQVPLGRVKLMDGFGPDLYRWERDYFLDHFVRRVCRIEREPFFMAELEEELFGLAVRLTEGPRCLIHRDFQSQNVMIREGSPHLIDFQGMRFGSPFYDLGSLLCDPYIHLSNGEREELLSFYYSLSNWNHDWSAFQNRFWEASAQRLMQALGAYGFLGLEKGLKAYLEHIPAGLRNLCLGTSHLSSLPRLQELSAQCERKIV